MNFLVLFFYEIVIVICFVNKWRVFYYLMEISLVSIYCLVFKSNFVQYFIWLPYKYIYTLKKCLISSLVVKKKKKIRNTISKHYAKDWREKRCECGTLSAAKSVAAIKWPLYDSRVPIPDYVCFGAMATVPDSHSCSNRNSPDIIGGREAIAPSRMD